MTKQLKVTVPANPLRDGAAVFRLYRFFRASSCETGRSATTPAERISCEIWGDWRIRFVQLRRSSL